MKSNRPDPEPTDDEVLAIIDSNLKSARDNATLGRGADAALFEISVLEHYKPKQIDRDLLDFTITEIAQDRSAAVGPLTMKDIGPILSKLKDLYGGQYNPSEASAIAKILIVGAPL